MSEKVKLKLIPMDQYLFFVRLSTSARHWALIVSELRRDITILMSHYKKVLYKTGQKMPF